MVKLTSGETVVGEELKVWSGGGMKLGGTLVMCFAPEGAIYLDTYMLGSDVTELDFAPHGIVTLAPAAEKLIDFYQRSHEHIKGRELGEGPFFTDAPKTVN